MTGSAVPTAMPAGQVSGIDAEAMGLTRMGVRPTLSRYVAELWARREFIWLIPRSELRSRSMHTFLGSAWHLLNPLLLAAVYYVIFGLILDIRNDIPNYTAWLVIGILVFFFTQKTVIGGARAVVNDVKLLQNVNFPAAVLPISTALSEGLSHLYALGAMLVVVMLTGERPMVVWVLLLPVAVVQLVFNAGLAFITARMTVHFRDTAEFLPYLMRIWMYLSGVLFGLERLEGSKEIYQTLFKLNPPYAFVRVTRDLILDGVVEPTYMALALGWAIVVFVLGFLFFWRREGEYASAI